MTQPCVDRPISWPILERMARGDVVAGHAQLTDHLRQCPACQAAADYLRTRPVQLRPLPPVMRRRVWSRRLTWASVGAAVVATIAITLTRSDNTRPRAALPAARVEIKGGDIAIELVRNRAGEITRPAHTYREGDRFKVLLTCPSTSNTHAIVLVVEGDTVSTPLPAQSVTCGNLVPLDGAVLVTGDSPIAICVRIDPHGTHTAPTTTRLQLSQLQHAACLQLTPEL